MLEHHHLLYHRRILDWRATLEKKKRGRPRKYGPDGAVASARALSQMPISTSAPTPSGEFSNVKQCILPSTDGFLADKRGKVRSIGSDGKPKHEVGTENLGDCAAYSSGQNFTPHVLTVNPGEDVGVKILSSLEQGPRAICILSAAGLISNVKLGYAGTTETHEGQFQIVSLSGSVTPTKVRRVRAPIRSGYIVVSLACPDGRVVGGRLAGHLIAASPVKVIVGSYLPCGHLEPKAKKAKSNSKVITPTTGSAETRAP